MKKQIKAKEQYTFGIIMIAVGAVFAIAINPGLGVAFIVLGVLFMLMGAKNKK